MIVLRLDLSEKSLLDAQRSLFDLKSQRMKIDQSIQEAEEVVAARRHDVKMLRPQAKRARARLGLSPLAASRVVSDEETSDSELALTSDSELAFGQDAEGVPPAQTVIRRRLRVKTKVF